jgi:hypothetical protein
MIKMNEGVSQDDLLLGLKLAELTGMDLRKFLRLRDGGSSWAEITAGMSKYAAVRQDTVLQSVMDGMKAPEAGALTADEMISSFFNFPRGGIKKFRESGLSEKEVTLLLILSRAGKIKPVDLLAQYREKGKSWAEIAHNMDMEPDAAGKLIMAFPDETHSR